MRDDDAAPAELHLYEQVGLAALLTQNGGGWLDGDNVAHAVHLLVV